MSINLAAVGVVPTAHDAATSKRYLEALRELQAECERLRAHVQEAADISHSKHVQIKRGKKWITISAWHLAALNPTESNALGETK